MTETKQWTVEITIDENGGYTRAEAWLQSEPGVRMVGTGRAKLNPSDMDVPEIGDELAVARALSDLGHRMLVTAASDIESVTHQPAHIHG